MSRIAGGRARTEAVVSAFHGSAVAPHLIAAWEFVVSTFNGLPGIIHTKASHKTPPPQTLLELRWYIYTLQGGVLGLFGGATPCGWGVPHAPSVTPNGIRLGLVTNFYFLSPEKLDTYNPRLPL